MKQPNVLFVFADQWRRQSFGYTGNPDVQTQHIDRFAAESIELPHAVSTCPVCSPFRASLMTGRYPLEHRIITNDVMLDPELPSLGSCFKDNGYQTAYVGKWHLHGSNRSGYIPPEHRMGFDYWKVLECTHDYFNSKYYDNDETNPSVWDGYDADAQTEDIISYLKEERDPDKPFLAVLSWGPPHAPPPYAQESSYDQFPEDLCDLYKAEELHLRPNVPDEMAETVRGLLAGYYTHCTALDRDFGRLLDYIDESGLADDTIVVFTSDHGDSLGSQGLYKKQNPFEESIRIPFLIRIPGAEAGKHETLFLEPEDILPTLLGLCGLGIPDSLNGVDCADRILNRYSDGKEFAFLASYVANGQWKRGRNGGPLGFTGRDFRGITTKEYTYVRDLDGPWLLFNNRSDPYQMENLVDLPDYAEVQKDLEEKLAKTLEERNDEFRPGEEYVRQWGFDVDESCTVKFWG